MDEDVDGIGRRKSPASNQMNAMQQQHQISIKQETMSDVSGASIQPNLNHNLFPVSYAFSIIFNIINHYISIKKTICLQLKRIKVNFKKTF